MRLLKAPPGIRVIPREALGAREHALRLVERARVDAQTVLEHARTEAGAIREAARREGEALGRAEANALLAREAIRRSAGSETEAAHVAELALEVARAVLGREAQSSADVVRDVAQRALARVRRARRIVLRVHPDELERARDGMRSWLPAGLEPDVLDAEADASVEPGGVIVESDIGRLDARLDTQLAALRRAFVDPAGSRGGA